ncbi:MAG TPA: acyl-CoA dehydrogenase family protein [Anaeromyxobacteraceae bacterium]|nr:acyl-CoA dehydrogenase family protein [Anaeromyxobacteraceae bacterium]
MITDANPYAFDRFLAWRDAVDYWADDAFLREVVRRHAGRDAPHVEAAAAALSRKASGRWRVLSDAIAAPESRPRLAHWDAFHRRVDRVVRPAEALELEREVFAEGLFSSRTDRLTRAVLQFLVYENGEACVACPLVCTEGLVEALDELADRPETLAMREHLKEGRDGRHAIGAQFLTEIQGGSDVPANRVLARRDGDGYRIHGTKFFCSVAHADHAAVTARDEATGALGLFALPLWAPGREGLERNRLTIDRLKTKMGTCELPTAEVTFDGAAAWALGPVERGLANAVRIVLTTSRLTIGLASAAYATRAVREARAWAGFREAFGRPIAGFPMVRAQLEDLERAVQRATAGAFEVHRLHREASAARGTPAVADGAGRRRAHEARTLVMLQKVVGAEDATRTIQEAMGILGGNGAVEDFTAIPRLFRDSAVNELWEGPRNVLLDQVHRDIRKASDWYPPAELVTRLLGREDASARELGREVAALVAGPDLSDDVPGALEACRRWDAACRALVHGFQDAAVQRVST